jgi:hypothetical protein
MFRNRCFAPFRRIFFFFANVFFIPFLAPFVPLNVAYSSPPMLFAQTIQTTQPFARETSGYPLLIGAADGLYGLSKDGSLSPLWQGGSVRKIVRGSTGYWAILTGKGIAFSKDLQNWEMRNDGLPVQTVKIYENGQKSFIRPVQDIKDFEASGEMMVLATKDEVFFSRNEGKTWESMGTPYTRTNGIKAVAIARLPELTVFASHSIYGISYRNPAGKSAWAEISAGLEKLETTDNPDEVSDIAVAVENGRQVVYASQTFRRRLYRLDWTRRRWDTVWSDKSDFGTVDSLDAGSLNAGKGGLRFVREDAVMEIGGVNAGMTDAGSAATSGIPSNPSGNQPTTRSDILGFVKNMAANLGIAPSCVLLSSKTDSVNLSELWLLVENGDPRLKAAWGKEGLYLPMYNADIKQAADLIAKKGLNMITVDMKDEYGRLRWTPKTPGIADKGRVFNPIDIDAFIKTMKASNVWTVARIVAFKDQELVKKDGGKYAIWDSRTNRPWQGYYEKRQKKGEAKKSADTEIFPSGDPDYEIVRTYISEYWVDPYSEEVWEYLTNIARELEQRGFDEIQFDYIRLPTDGDNLGSARYRWKDTGMDRDSNLVSFLNHIRSRIKAPISIDIYGANGWYRTGSRTGQDVELLAPYVDVICPMYYPSHFEQDFLAQYPAELRPYRIYRLGTGRTSRIARNSVVIRSWAQAFYLNVSYDRKYYNEDYVRRQIEGVRDAGSPGYTYWNASSRYDDVADAAKKVLPLP